MINVNAITPLQYLRATPAQSENKDSWFDAIDYVELKEKWFDACETLPAEAAAETVIPFTEDCRRCVKQLVSMLGSYKQSEFLARGLTKIFPGIPVNILFAADSLYVAITEKRNIDIAVLHALGLTSGLLPENSNIISWVAGYIRNTVLEYAGEAFCRQFLTEDENPTASYIFSILAIAAIAARHWLRDEQSPQRRLLQVPAFIANLLVRASHYWKALGNMIQPDTTAEKAPVVRPAFEIDTSVEVTQLQPESTASPLTHITAFLSNSTTLYEFTTKASEAEKATIAPPGNNNLAEKAHLLAMMRAKQETGLAELFNCDTHKTETIERQRERILIHTHFNTQCDATELFAPHQQAHHNIIKKLPAPEAHVYSVSGQNDANPLLPLMTTAAVASTARSFLPVTGSKKLLIASSIAGATILTLGGKFLFNKFYGKGEINTPQPDLAYVREKRLTKGEKKSTVKKNNIERIIVAGRIRDIFKKFKLQSDSEGNIKKASPHKLINSHILSFGSKMYNSEGFFTLTLPRTNDAIKSRAAGVYNSIKKGMNEINFAIRINTHTTKTLFFSINGEGNRRLLTMSKLGQQLIINHSGREKIINNAFNSVVNAVNFQVILNKGTTSFITVLMDTHKIFEELMEKGTQQFFIGIACGAPGKYFRSVDIKDVSRNHTVAHVLHADWHNYISVMGKAGIKFDRSVNPFNKASLKFYRSKENLLIQKSRQELVKNMFTNIRHKRSIQGEATFTTVLNAASIVYLIRVLGDPKASREDKEIAVSEYLKTTVADAFAFSYGLVDHMDPYSVVSKEYAAGIKGLLRTGGAAVGIIFNAMNFIDGVKENDIPKIVSSTIGIAGAIAGVVLSGLTGFGVSLFFLGLKLIFDSIGDAKHRGEARENYFRQTILHKQRNKLFHYTWMSKTNQDGNSDDRYNPFKLDNGNTPSLEQTNDADDKPLFYTTYTGDVDITPEMAGGVNGTTTFNTDPNSKKEGFIGYNTRIQEKDDEITHLIYASHHMIPDTNYIGHENVGKDSILADGSLLKGDDTIVSGSIKAKIDAGEGNDIIFITGHEESIDGGAGANLAIIDGSGGKVTLSIYGDGDASLSSGTKLLNIAAFIITGKGHKVIINTGGLNNIVPIIVCQGDGIIILRNPVGNGEEAIVKEYGSKERVKEGKIFKYHTVLNRVSIGEKTIAMQKGFGVKQLYVD